MNVFIAVISSAYDDCLVEAAKYFEKFYIDVSFYKSRSKAMKSDVLKYYFKPMIQEDYAYYSQYFESVLEDLELLNSDPLFIKNDHLKIKIQKATS